MQDQKENTGKKDDNNNNENAASLQSSVDSKNEAATGGTPSATDRVKPRAGDGLANEGTNVSYEEER